MKEGVDFHLFITTSPCGDARIFSLHEAPTAEKKEKEMTKVDSSVGLAKIVEEPENSTGGATPSEQTAKSDAVATSNGPVKNEAEDSLLDGNTSLEEVAKKLESMNLNQSEDGNAGETGAKFEIGVKAEDDEGVMVEDAVEEVNNNQDDQKVDTEVITETDVTSTVPQFSLESTPAVSGCSTPAVNPKGDGFEEEEFKIPHGLVIPTIVIDQYDDKEGRKEKPSQDASRYDLWPPTTIHVS